MTDHIAICEREALRAGADSQWVHLIPLGDIRGRDGRRFRLADPQRVVAAFQRRGGPLVVDYEHASTAQRQTRPPQAAPAAGWITALEARADGVWGRVEWTAKARAMIASREYRFISPVLMFRPLDGDVLELDSAGLVHNPNLRLTALNDMRKDAMTHDPNPAGADKDGGGDLRAALCNRLDLNEGASDADILTAINDLRTATPDPAEYMPVDAVAELLKERASTAALMSEDAAARKVEAALNGGYITPAMKGWALSLCSADPERFDEFMETAAPAWAHLQKPMDDVFKATALNARDSRAAGGDAEGIARQLGIDPKSLN